jgi:hypothetical protein
MLFLSSLVLLVRVCHSAGELNVITFTAGHFDSFGTQAIAPAFKVALDDMSEKFPEVFRNHTRTSVESLAKENPCTPDGDWTVLLKMAELFGQGKLDPQRTVFLTASKSTLPIIYQASLKLPFFWITYAVLYIFGW